MNFLGDCDTVVAELARRAGWDLKHNMLPEDLKVDVVPINEVDHTWGVKARSLDPKPEPL
jgi:NAD+-dependent protein deacetylase SIR2